MPALAPMTRFRWSLLVGLLATPCAGVAAQAWPVPVGARVRVWNDRERPSGVLADRGLVVTVSADSLVITEEWSQQPLTIPTSLITRIDVSRGVLPRRAGILRGAKRGLKAGLLIAPLLVLERRKDGDGFREWTNNLLTSTAITTAHGVAVGGFLGTALSHTRWERIPAPQPALPSDSTESQR